MLILRGDGENNNKKSKYRSYENNSDINNNQKLCGFVKYIQNIFTDKSIFILLCGN